MQKRSWPILFNFNSWNPLSVVDLQVENLCRHLYRRNRIAGYRYRDITGPDTHKTAHSPKITPTVVWYRQGNKCSKVLKWPVKIFSPIHGNFQVLIIFSFFNVILDHIHYTESCADTQCVTKLVYKVELYFIHLWFI